MIVNDDVGCLNARVARTFFASRLAPTVDRVHLRVIDRPIRPPSLRCGAPTSQRLQQIGGTPDQAGIGNGTDMN